MVAEEITRRRKLPFIIAGVVAVLALVYMAVFGFSKGKLVTDHDRYYPERAAFYMEIAPSEKLATRVLSGMDQMRGMVDKHPPLLSLSSTFNKDFEPIISMGFWDMKPHPKPEESPSSYLVVVTVKKGVTLQQVADDFKLPKDAYTITPGVPGTGPKTTGGKPDTLISKAAGSAKTVMALDGNHLLLTNSQAVLDEALAQDDPHKKLLANPLFRDNLKYLSQRRQGTILSSSSGIPTMDPSDPMVAKAMAARPAMKRFVDLQQEFAQAVPGSVMGIEIQNDRLVRINCYSPTDLGKITNASFRKDIQDLLTQTYTFDVPTVLPQTTVVYFGVSNLSKYYDMYVNYVASDSDKRMIADTENKAKMFGLDLRKNVIGIFDGKFGVSLLSNAGHPDVSVFFDYNENTKKTLAQLTAVATAALQAQQSEKAIDDKHTLTVLESPASSTKLAFGNVLQDTVAIGTQGGVEEIFSVQQHKAEALNNSALYKELTAGMPAKGNFIFFISFKDGVKLLEKVTQTPPDPKSGMPKTDAKQREKALDFLKSFEGVAALSTADSDRMMHGVMTLKLSP